MEAIVGHIRRQTVAARARQWADALVDFGPYNTLLHFKDTKTASLDVTGAVPQSVTSLLAGRRTRLASLFPDAADHMAACTRARSLRRKMVELDEEQGIEAGRLALGLLRVEPPPTRGRTPVPALRAPLLLQPLSIQPRTATENDFVLEAAGETETNPVPLYALSRQYGLDGDTEELADKITTVDIQGTVGRRRHRCLSVRPSTPGLVTPLFELPRHAACSWPYTTARSCAAGATVRSTGPTAPAAPPQNKGT